MMSTGTQRLLLGALPLVALLGCAGDPTIQTGDDAERIMGTLSKVDNSRMDMAYVDPDGDYARYTRVFVMPLDTNNIEIIQPSSSSSSLNRYNREWELTEDDKAKLQAAFKDAMEQELTEGGAFALADAGGDDVITVEAMITAIAPSGPKDDNPSRTMGRSRVYSEGAGGMSIAIMIADGDSGEVLAMVKDTRNSNNSTWGLNNSVSNMAEVRRNFTAWAKTIHNGLLGLQARAASEAAN
ncbi:MAG: hypothetical protein ACI87W_002026 [Halieaceae bacterium]|jgi:hypothetical protein